MTRRSFTRVSCAQTLRKQLSSDAWQALFYVTKARGRADLWPRLLPAARSATEFSSVRQGSVPLVPGALDGCHQSLRQYGTLAPLLVKSAYFTEGFLRVRW